MFLDRMSLSAKNHWFDETGHVYIIFTIDEIMRLSKQQFMSCQ